MCEGMKKSTPLKRWAYDELLQTVWKTSIENCSVDPGERADRHDAPMIVYVAQVIDAFGGYPADDLQKGYGTISRGAGAAYAISRLDRGVLERESAQLPAFAKQRLLEAYDFAAADVKLYEAWRAKQHSGVWKTGYAAAIASVHKDFTEHADDIAAGITAIDAAAEGKACRGDMRARFDAFVAKAAPKTKTAALDLLHRSATAEVLWHAVAQCAIAEGDHELGALAAAAGAVFNSNNAIRGPQARVAAALRAAYEATTSRGVLEPEKSGGGDLVKLALDAKPKDLYLANAPVSDGILSSFWGVVATKQPKGKGWIEITFKKNMQRNWVQSCSSSNKISRIDEHGNVEYASDCSLSKGAKQDVSPHPVRMPEAMANRLAAGELVFFIELTDSQTNAKAKRFALPLDVYKGGKPGVLVGLFGAHW
jgi:hypothetical protein